VERTAIIVMDGHDVPRLVERTVRLWYRLARTPIPSIVDRYEMATMQTEWGVRQCCRIICICVRDRLIAR